MASTAPQDTTVPASKYPNVSGVVTIEAPPLKEKGGKPELNLEARSVRTTDQAWNLCKSTESANKTRSQRATMMELEYSGQAPFSQTDQIEKANSWQSNTSTGILAGIVDRKTLRFVNAITSQIYLTRSSLPTSYPDWKKKSDLFDIHTTRMIQSWKKYSTFIPALARENVLHGYAYGVFLDPYTWTPRMFKQDVSYVPDESSQYANELQFYVIKHDFLLHEFIDLFKDEKAAEEMGYNIPNCIMAANTSEIKNPREDMMVTEFRKFAEFISDGVLGLTYSVSGPRVVKTYLLWNREYDGKVSFWILLRDNGKLLRFAEKIYDSFDEVVTLFSFQPGNGHLHSSKGIGRMIIGNVRIAERIRNRMVDNVNMSSLVILKADSANRNKLQPVVHAPFVVIDKSIEVDQQKFSADGEMYAALDQRMVNYMEQAAGAYVSANPNASGQPVTATEASQDAQRERENSDITEARWRDQFSQLVQTMQKRAFSDDHIKEARELFTKITEQFVTQGSDSNEVMKTITDLMDTTDESRLPVRTLVMMFMDGLTESEIRICRDAATSGYAHTDDAIVAQGILAVGRMYANNPNVDQVELTKRNVEALAGPDAAKALIIENPDQTIMAEATRMQQQEATTMMTLKMPVPVSPRDNHMAHAQVCMQLLIQAGQGISDLTTIDMFAKPTELLLNHFAEHLANYLAQGNPSQNPQFKEMNDFYKKFKSDFAQAVMIAEQQKMAAELVEQGATPEQVAAATNTQNPNLPPYSAGVGAPPTSPDMGTEQEGPDVEAIQTALAREAGEFAPPEIEERKKRAYYRPPGVE
jgi:hypothetical protein